MFDIQTLRELRRRLGLTQFAFAKEAGVSQSLIAKIESGKTDPSYSNAAKIAEAVQRLSIKKEKDAKSIMTKKIISVASAVPSRKVIEVMKKSQISQLPVFEKNRLVGLVSEAGILEKDLNKIKSLKAKDLMTEAPPVVSESTRISVVAALLRQFPIIIVTKNSKHTGVITKADLIKAIV